MEDTEENSIPTFNQILEVLKNTSRETYAKYFGIALLVATIIGILVRDIFIDVSGLLLSSLYLGSLYLCLSLGLTLTYKLLGFANFAHAEYFLVGAYTGVAWTLSHSIEEANLIDIVPVIFMAFVFGGVVALISDFVVFRPLRKRGSSQETLMISSIGVGIVIRNVVSMIYGGQTQYYRWYDFAGKDISSTLQIPTLWFGSRKNLVLFEGYNLPYEYIVTIVLTALLVGGLIAMLQYTKVGKALRATSDNKDLAESSGIDTEKMIWLVWFIGGGLAAVAGVMFALSFAVIPFTGFLFLLPAFAVVVFGGVGSLKGSIFASLIIAFIQQISTTYLRSMETILAVFNIERSGLPAYQTVVPFFVIILVLLFKPYGLYGEEEA